MKLPVFGLFSRYWVGKDFLRGSTGTKQGEETMSFESIFDAARAGRAEDVRHFVQKGTDVRAKNNNGGTLLHFAAINKNVEVAKFLISTGMDVDMKGERNSTALNVATCAGNLEVAKFFISQGADVNAKTSDAITALHAAAMISGNAEIAEALVSAGADINAKDEYGFTPLHMAAEKGHIEVAKYLVSKGANLNAKNGDGLIPLDIAKRGGSAVLIECLSAVVPNNDELSEIESVVSECEKEMQGGTICVETVMRHMQNAPTTDIAKAQEYADEYIRAKGTGRIDIHRLAGLMRERSDDSRIHELGSRAAKCYLKLSEIWLIASDKLMTPDFKSTMKIPSIQEGLNKAKKLLSVMRLHVDIFSAAKNGTVEDVQYFVEKKDIAVNEKDDSGWTPLHDAAQNNINTEVLIYLVSQGADVTAKDYNYGATPMFFAAMEGKKENIKCLVELGSDINAEDKKKHTPIFFAAGSGDLTSIEYLANLGADVNAKSIEGMTPIFFAATDGKIATLECLKKLGAQMDVKAQRGMTPMDLASMRGQAEAAEWLRVNS